MTLWPLFPMFRQLYPQFLPVCVLLEASVQLSRVVAGFLIANYGRQAMDFSHY